MPKISVIIPVYNAHEYLNRCLDSVVNQTLEDIEIICVDDCSTDDSVKILEKYALKDYRIKVIKRTENGGESRARNTGLENVTGEYIAFVDNDDTIDRDFFEKLYKKAIEENADISCGDAEYIDYNGKSFKNKHNIINIAKNKLYFSNNWWCAIYKTSLIKNDNIILEPGMLISADLIFLIKAVLAANKVVTVENIYYRHYDREDSGFSKVLSKEKILSGVKSIEIITDLLNKKNIDKTNPKGYDWLYKEQFNIFLNLHYHNNNEDLIELYLSGMTNIYSKCNRKAEFQRFLKNNYFSISQMIIENNKSELKNFLTHKTNRLNFITQNLRDKIRRGNK